VALGAGKLIADGPYEAAMVRCGARFYVGGKPYRCGLVKGHKAKKHRKHYRRTPAGPKSAPEIPAEARVEAPEPTPRATYEEFQTWLLRILNELDKGGWPRNHPIYQIRRYPDNPARREQFGQWLFDMERAQIIGMQSHNTPFVLDDEVKRDSLYTEHRGVIYYVMRKH
jgi:hypothetical protein